MGLRVRSLARGLSVLCGKSGGSNFTWVDPWSSYAVSREADDVKHVHS